MSSDDKTADAPAGEAAGETTGETTGGATSAPYESEEVAYGAIYVFAAVLVVLVIATLAGFSHEAATDDAPPTTVSPRPTKLPIPAGPRLATDPFSELRETRAELGRRVTTYAWVDKAGGVGRIPVDRAIEHLARHGLELPATKSAKVGGGGEEDGADPKEDSR